MGKAEVVLPAPESLLIDACDPLDYSTSASPVQAFLRRGGVLGNGTAALAGPVWNSVSGWLAEAGARNRGMVWAAAVSAAATVNSAIDTRWQLPIGFDMTGCPSAGLWPLRFRMETIIWRVTNPLVAAAPLAFVTSWTGGTGRILDNPATTFPGYELVSVSTVNGGRWTPRWRLASAGGLVTGADSGIDPAGVQSHIELRYDHGTNPRLSFLVNGVELPGSVLQGAANMPLGSSSLQTTGVVQGITVGGGAAQTDRRRQVRFRIEQLTGFPA